MKHVRLNVPMRTDEVAEILGWPTWKTARYLDGLCEKDPTIVIRVRGRRLVTLASLRRVDPEFGKHFPTDRDLEAFREEQDEQKRELIELANEFREFRRKSRDWYAQHGRRLNSVEQAIRDGRKRTDTDTS